MPQALYQESAAVALHAPSRLSGYKWVPFVVWILAFAAIPVWNAVDPGNGWDAKVIVNAIHSLQAGHDPYADGMAIAKVFHDQLALHPLASPPYFYVYSPLTLPLLRLVGSLPPMLYIFGYWLIYAAGVLAQIWVGMQAAEPEERRYFAFLAPAAAFFPGLLQHDAVMSGNLAFILYGLIFLAALLGWRRGRWRWFYVAVLIASCFKAPYLSLLAIPVLSARRQWIPAGITGATGVALFGAQLWIWPSYFHNYLRALELIFSYDHGFGVGPAGLISCSLLNAGLPYAAGTIFYFFFAIMLFGLLLYLSRQFLAGEFSLERWIPVMITGVFLLSPRIQEYDVAPLALFMALILWRTVSSFTGAAWAIAFCSLFFVVANAVVIYINSFDIADYYWNHIECFLLVGTFAAGSWNLLWQTSLSRNQLRNPIHNPVDVVAILAD
ncbi:MAG: hypothetical protein ABSD72_11350 [Terracidiphilus sp.]|jgi:hypothetical protein